MTFVDQKTKSIRKILFPIIGTITTKTYFSYYGLFKNGQMFGLYKDGRFYLHIAKQTLTEIKNNNDIYLLQDEKSGIHAKTFYYIPPRILNNIDRFKHWFTESIQDISTQRIIKNTEKKKQIRSLPNMTVGFERILKKLNIYTIDDLIKRGEINIFVDLLRIGIDVDKATLFKLYGAIHHQLIYTLSDKEKLLLLKEANEALYQAGLRKRFRIN